MRKAVLPLIAPMLLSLPACGRTDGTYPSLALRPTEAKGFSEPDTPAPTAPVADPALDTRVAQARLALAAIGNGFDRDAAVAQAAASRPGAATTASDAWLDAQSALAKLDDWRAQASSATTDADAIASARAAALQPPYPAVEALRRAAAAEVAREDASIGQLARRLPVH